MLILGNYYVVEMEEEEVEPQESSRKPGEFNLHVFSSALHKALKDFALENMQNYGRLVEYFDIINDMMDNSLATSYEHLALMHANGVAI